MGLSPWYLAPCRVNLVRVIEGGHVVVVVVLASVKASSFWWVQNHAVTSGMIDSD